MSTNDKIDLADERGETMRLLQDCRSALDGVRLPLDLPKASPAFENARSAVAQLDDYVLPRYQNLDAPLLAVVGGSTGAGKSTLVNSLVGHGVTRSGAIRPTTRQPILLHHPAEADWFTEQRILPGLPRTTGRGSASGPLPGGGTVPREPNRPGTTDSGKRAGDQPGGQSLVLIADPAIPRGIALLDAPDIDSVSEANRKLAAQLLSAADLWVFVTTANRYADAVPWRLLTEASARNILIAIVLDRVPPGVETAVAGDLRGLLMERGLGEAELFVVPEAVVTEEMLPAGVVQSLGDWLGSLTADAAGRSEIARRTLSGVVAQLAERSAVIAGAQKEQQENAALLAANVTEHYDDAFRRISEATREGTLLRGEVLARWQDFVGTGEFFRSLETGIGKLRDRIGTFFAGRPQPIHTVEEAIETGLHAVVVNEAAKAAESCEKIWRSTSATRPLIGATDLGSVSPGFSDHTAAAIREWQGELLELIRREGAGKRFTARMVSFGVNGVAVALMVVVFASTAGLTGLEVGIAGGSAVVGQKLLESIFGEDAVRRLARKAREGLEARVQVLLAEEKSRFLTLLSDVPGTEEIDALMMLSHRLRTLARDTQTEAL